MAAHRRNDRPREGYRISPTLPKPWGRVGPWQTGFFREREANRVEAWLHEMALKYPDLIDGLVENRFSLRDAWVAHLRGPDHLAELAAGRGDPLLADAVAEYRAICNDRRIRNGLDKLLDLTPENVRLSWLREAAATKAKKPPRNISSLYRRALEDWAPDTVRRALHWAVRGLLVHEFDEEGARQRLAGAASIVDAGMERDVYVSPEELQRLVAAIDIDRFRWLVLTAVLTTADQGPLLRLRATDFREHDGMLMVHDTKTRTRTRLIVLGSAARTVLRLATAGLEPTELVFPYTANQVGYRWERARSKVTGRPNRDAVKRGVPDPVGDEADRVWRESHIVTLPILRFKDLRHLLPTALAALKVDRKEIKHVLGHAAGSRSTDRYIAPAGEVAHMDAAAEWLGLEAAHLTRAG